MAELGQEGAGLPSAAPRARRRWPLLAAAGVVAVAGTLALVALDRPVGEASRFTATEAEQTGPAAAPDPLRAELLRCRTLPPEVNDPSCRAAWDESRRLFFGELGDPRPAARRTAPGSLAPTLPAADAQRKSTPASPVTEREEH